MTKPTGMSVFGVPNKLWCSLIYRLPDEHWWTANKHDGTHLFTFAATSTFGECVHLFVWPNTFAKCKYGFAFFTIIGHRIIGWDPGLYQNVTSNTLNIFQLKTKNLIFFDQITLDRVFSKSCFLTLCMVSHIASHMLNSL